MRFTKIMILGLLMQSTFATGLLAAGQDTHVKNGSRNNDANLAREVRHELLELPWYSVFDILQYTVNGSEVTLKGQVSQPTLKSDAENVVKRIEGVERVNNQIEVLPTSPMDDQLRRAEYRAIYSQSNLSRYGLGTLQAIHIIVKSGHVTLEGVVDSEQDKDVAGIAAKGVPNVFSVENHLVVGGSK